MNPAPLIRLLENSNFIALVTQPGLECFPPKEEVAGSNPAESVGFELTVQEALQRS